MTNEQLPVVINEENVKNIVKTLDENTKYIEQYR